MRPTRTTTSLFLLSTIAITGYSATARAVDEYSIILLDRTGSMSTNTNTADPTQTRWTDAMEAAASVILVKDKADLSIDRAYAIWDFRLGAGTTGGPNNDTTQDNAKQVWPLQASDCTSLCATKANCAAWIQVPALSGITNNYCDFGNTSAPQPYDALVALLRSYKTDINRTPDANFMGRTPLADSLCRTLNTLRLANINSAQTITLESDGLENQSSLGDCGNYSIDSTAVPFSTDPASTWNKALADWGMSAPAGSGAPDAINSPIVPGGGSWEARVVRRALHLTNSSSAAATASSIQPNEPASSNIAWRVQVHYATFDSTTPTPLAAVAPTTLTAAAAAPNSSNQDKSAVVHTYTVSAPLAGITPPMLAAAAATSGVKSATAATTSTIVVDIPAAELSLFRQMASPSFPSKGNGASRSFFQPITLLPGQTYGTNHKLAGDVDDSGCVDHADYSIMTQKDVWYSRALPPNQIGMRADLNKDGWVNEADRTILLANWGKGCINNPGPKPKI